MNGINTCTKKNSSTGKTMRTQVFWHRQKKIPGLLTVNLMKFKFELLKRTSDTQCSILLSIAPARSMYACLQLLLRSLPGRNVLHPTSSRNVSPCCVTNALVLHWLSFYWSKIVAQQNWTFFLSKFQFCSKTGFMFLNKKLSLPFEIRRIPPPGWVWMISMSTDNGMKCMLTQTVM